MGGGGDYYGSKVSYSKKKSGGSKSDSIPSKSAAPAEAPHTVMEEPPVADAQTKEALLASFVIGADKTGIDVAFSFDTTGSMYPCLEEVRKKLQEITKRLLAEIPNIRIAIIAHGDFCDQRDSYVIKMLDFSTDPQKICGFVKDVGKTGGGDSPECYELALRDSMKLSWDDSHSKALIIIGDEVPHPNSYTDQEIFWKDVLRLLTERGIVVYGVQALSNAYATPFYSEIASQTGGFHLHLRDFALITEMFVAVCFRATSQEKFDDYKKKVEEKGDMTEEVQQMFSEMAKPTAKKTFNIREAWWDLQFDKGKPQYSWDGKAWISKK